MNIPGAPTLNVNLKRIQKTLNSLGPDKVILDVGCGHRKIVPRAIGVDFQKYPGVDVVADIHKLPYGDGTIDAVVAKAVLEHVKEPGTVVAEIKRVLKKDGLIYVEVPFLQAYHPAPADFIRYTTEGLQSLLKDFEIYETGVCVGPTGMMAGLLKEYVPFVISIPLIRGLLYFTLGWVFFPFQFLDYLLVRKKKAIYFASSIYCLGKKK